MKIEEQVLSREQMAHLVELGVDTSDASMIWLINKDNPSIVSVEVNDLMPYVGNCSCDIIPTYTIGDLIEKLPIKIKNGFGEFSRNISIEEEFIDIGYQNCSDYSPTPCFCGSLLEQLYALLCWVAENHKELIK